MSGHLAFGRAGLRSNPEGCLRPVSSTPALMNFYVLIRTHNGNGVRVWSGQDEPQGFSLRRAHPNTLFWVTS